MPTFYVHNKLNALAMPTRGFFQESIHLLIVVNMLTTTINILRVLGLTNRYFFNRIIKIAYIKNIGTLLDVVIILIVEINNLIKKDKENLNY